MKIREEREMISPQNKEFTKAFIIVAIYFKCCSCLAESISSIIALLLC